MTDHAAAAQKAAEERLTACWEAYDAECAGEPSEDLWPEGAGLFDGCLTCEVREVLHAAFPHLLAMAREQLVEEEARPKPEPTTGVDTVSLFELDEIQLLPGTVAAIAYGCRCPEHSTCPLHGIKES